MWANLHAKTKGKELPYGLLNLPPTCPAFPVCMAVEDTAPTLSKTDAHRQKKLH